MTKAFDGIAAGLKDAIAFVQGDSTRGRVAAGSDVRAIRAKTKLGPANRRRAAGSTTPTNR
jgi:putative transcriptional regulator